MIACCRRSENYWINSFQVVNDEKLIEISIILFNSFQDWIRSTNQGNMLIAMKTSWFSQITSNENVIKNYYIQAFGHYSNSDISSTQSYGAANDYLLAIICGDWFQIHSSCFFWRHSYVAVLQPIRKKYLTSLSGYRTIVFYVKQGQRSSEMIQNWRCLLRN